MHNDAKITLIISIEGQLVMVAACSTALQLVPSLDETYARTASRCEENLV